MSDSILGCHALDRGTYSSKIFRVANIRSIRLAYRTLIRIYYGGRELIIVTRRRTDSKRGVVAEGQCDAVDN